MADVLQQWLKVGGKRLARPMQVTRDLIEIIAEAAQLRVNQMGARIRGLRISWPMIPVKQKRATEMHRSQPNGPRAPLQVGEFGIGQADIELTSARFGFGWSAHRFVSLGRAQASWGLGTTCPVPNEGFP